MNLHQVASSVISSVNPMVPVSVQISTGAGAPNAAGLRLPSFATPGAITAAIAGSVLTVSAISKGKLMVGQSLADLTSVLAFGTLITGQISGTPGGIGTYSINNNQTVSSEPMTTSLTLAAQIQSLTYGDLRQADAINLQGTKRGIYFTGAIDGLVRPDNKGGDIITFPNGTVWLVAIVLESWQNDVTRTGWCKVAATLQNAA